MEKSPFPDPEFDEPEEAFCEEVAEEDEALVVVVGALFDDPLEDPVELAPDDPGASTKSVLAPKSAFQASATAPVPDPVPTVATAD